MQSVRKNRDGFKKTVKKRFEADGFDVISSGIPDLILLKNGTIQFIEVKDGKDCVHVNQKKTMRTLLNHGFDVKILKKNEVGEETSIDPTHLVSKPLIPGYRTGSKFWREFAKEATIVKTEAKYIFYVNRRVRKLMKLVYTWSYDNPKYKGKFRRFKPGQLIRKLAPNMLLFNGDESVLNVLNYHKQRNNPGDVEIYEVEGEIQAPRLS